MNFLISLTQIWTSCSEAVSMVLNIHTYLHPTCLFSSRLYFFSSTFIITPLPHNFLSGSSLSFFSPISSTFCSLLFYSNMFSASWSFLLGRIIFIPSTCFFFSLLISITSTCFSAYFQQPEKPFSISVFSYGIKHASFSLGERGRCCCMRVCRLNGGLFLKSHLTIHSSDQHLIGQIMSWAAEHDPPLSEHMRSSAT